MVDTITANRDAWLATMMDEELRPQPVETPDIFRSAVVITIATLVGDWLKKGLQMVVIGLGAAAIGFLIGRLFHTAGA